MTTTPNKIQADVVVEHAGVATSNTRSDGLRDTGTLRRFRLLGQRILGLVVLMLVALVVVEPN